MSTSHYSLATGSSGCLHLIHFSFTLFASAERLHNKWTHWHLESSTEVQWSCFHMHFLSKCHSARACLGALASHMEPGLFWRLSLTPSSWSFLQSPPREEHSVSVSCHLPPDALTALLEKTRGQQLQFFTSIF